MRISRALLLFISLTIYGLPIRKSPDPSQISYQESRVESSGSTSHTRSVIPALIKRDIETGENEQEILPKSEFVSLRLRVQLADTITSGVSTDLDFISNLATHSSDHRLSRRTRKSSASNENDDNDHNNDLSVGDTVSIALSGCAIIVAVLVGWFKPQQFAWLISCGRCGEWDPPAPPPPPPSSYKRAKEKVKGWFKNLKNPLN